VRAPPNVAVRRFALVWTASTAVKVAALALLFVLVFKLSGGF